jgi:phosphomannomutase
MNKIFIFDVDGTLTPSRQVMDPEFYNFFQEWGRKNTFYLVSGSDMPKLKEQMAELDGLALGIFTCCGNEFWADDELQYQNTFTPPEDLKSYIVQTLSRNDYPVKAGGHIEDRGSMVNFSIVGRDCTLAERQDYFEYDKVEGEREKIATYINTNFPDLEAVIGGQISIDIYPKGYDKSQILQHIKSKYNEYIFIGDRTMPGGNDYPLAALMKRTDNCSVYQVENFKETRKLLTTL